MVGLAQKMGYLARLGCILSRSKFLTLVTKLATSTGDEMLRKLQMFIKSRSRSCFFFLKGNPWNVLGRITIFQHVGSWYFLEDDQPNLFDLGDDPGTGLWRYCTWWCAIDKLQTVHDSAWAARLLSYLYHFLSFFFLISLISQISVLMWFRGWGATSTEFYHHEIRGLRSCSGRCLWPVMWWHSPSINLCRTSDSTPTNSPAALLEFGAVVFLSLLSGCWARSGPEHIVLPIASFELLANPELWGGIVFYHISEECQGPLLSQLLRFSCVSRTGRMNGSLKHVIAL